MIYWDSQLQFESWVVTCWMFCELGHQSIFDGKANSMLMRVRQFIASPVEDIVSTFLTTLPLAIQLVCFGKSYDIQV